MFRVRVSVRVRARARTRARVAAVDPYKSNSQQNLSVSEKYYSCRPICMKIGTNIYDLLKRRVQKYYFIAFSFSKSFSLSRKIGIFGNFLPQRNPLLIAPTICQVYK